MNIVEIDAKQHARLILFNGYNNNNFITLTDKQTGEKTFVVVGK